jgi:hypothetical protein
MKRHYRIVVFILSLKAILLLSCSFSRQIEPIAIKECGINPAIKRTFRSGSRATFDLPKHRIVRLLSVQRHKSLSALVIAIDRYGQQSRDESHKIYLSDDRGISWHTANEESGCRQHSSITYAYGCVISNADSQTRYKPNSNMNSSFFSVSHDGGKSWNNVKSKISGVSSVNKVTVVETGEYMAGRLYTWVDARKGGGLYISDDFGQTLNRFSSQVFYAKESKTGSHVYGLKGNIANLDSMALVVSHNNGKNWKSLENAKELFKPLYRSDLPTSVQSWKKNENDEELFLTEFPIDQIEIDPWNAEIIYLRSLKGLYRSRDGGLNFRLLPLEKDLLLGIDNIGVDPIDGRYIFAAVNEDAVYRSSDYGCTWHELMLPE